VTTSPSARSSERQLEESPKGEAPRPSLKPNIKTNMLAREERVTAAAMRPGKSAGERELFTEQTNSVLVHENGGVIQLSATVARGQLLFLANVESRCEVVAQVTRIYKRNRYVELEFAEPAPRFWGMEFSAAAALLPRNTKDAEAAAAVTSAEAGDDAGEPPPAPTVEEVQALKREMELLRQQAPGMNAPRNSLPAEHDPVPKQFTTTDEAQLPNPSLDFAVSLAKPRSPIRAKGNFTPGFRGGVLRLALLTAALVVTAFGAAWFKHWTPWKSATKKPSVRIPAIALNARTAPRESREVALQNSEFINTNVASDAPVTSPTMPPHISESPGQPLASSGSAAQPPVRRTSPSTTPAAKRMVRPPAKATSDAVVPSAVESASPMEGVIVPPKLIKSVRAVASLEALRDFETGNVVIDAVVGTEGEMHFIKVLSGPPSLRSPAVEAVKQYRYEPATRNGQPVPEHVTITIRFRFES
jgi:periplasmic protein TonB